MRCPYVSDFEAVGKKVPYSASLPGRWFYEEDELQIEPLDSLHFRYHYRARGEQPHEGIRGRAYQILLDGRAFFVAGIEEKGDVQYMTLRIDTLTGSELLITWLDDEQVEDRQVFRSAKAFTNFVRKAEFPEQYQLSFRRRRVADSTAADQR